ncbi:hypothetical protein DYBT9275_01916 [Dyadobacter sp. CECT 9275]|uniref:Uncharacterized protein n=1 Tax=Dyadobacter helix TaxID=2822344 RepID=A0A916JB75_9BACT|nr:hypothetical protein [Dyadobacter sp. CECT 9275]CAG4998057.1 hypothetical protein DYBT9275_01916 [Dyadobacter sp. CECT 9275]
MHKRAFISAILLSVGLAISASAQSKVDPGISTHNYKHPNKAAQAKAQGEGTTIRVSSISTAERYSKQQNNRYVSTTPKYAPRPSTLVVTKSFEPEPFNINPLTSVRNYKTSHIAEKKGNSELATYRSTTDSTTYPTID